MRAFCNSCLMMLVGAATWCFAQKVITVDYSVTEGKIKELMGANLGPSSRSAGYRDAGITLVRMHDYHGANDYPYYSTFWKFDQEAKAFTTLNPRFNPLEPDHYNWTDFDAQTGRLVQDGFIPYIRLGVSYPNPHYFAVPYEPPFDADAPTFERFASLCKHTVMHCNSGWANGTHHQVRYWEVWNEPDGVFWKGSALQFYLLFRTVYDSLKALDPELKIGAPGVAPITTLNVKKEYSDGFLANLVQQKGRLDFYSWHLYGIKNPYALNYFADYFRDKLDRFGFKNTESHISEINNTLDSNLVAFTNSGRGAAYYVSLLITAQRSAVDKLFWYQGNGFFEPDLNGQPQHTWSGLGLKAYSTLVKHTGWQLASSGDETVAGHWQADTTNLVSLAARSDDGNEVCVLTANYSSPYSDLNIQIKNLPWRSGDSITVMKSVLREPSDPLTTTSTVISGAPTLWIAASNLAAPAVLLLRLIRNTSTAAKSSKATFLPATITMQGNYPNPFNDETVIHFELAQSEKIELDIYNLHGKKVASLAQGVWLPGEYQVKWNATLLPSGIFFCKLQSAHNCLVGKMTLVH
jgi:hypothetical protein